MAGNPIKQLKQTPGGEKHLAKADMTLKAGTAGEESVVAEYQTDLPLVVREGTRARIMFAAAEEFTTNATAGDAETFSLSHDYVSTVNASDFVLYAGGNRVQPDSTDTAANTFSYTDGGTGTTLHAFYTARDPGAVRIEKVAPRSGSQVTEDLHEDTTSALADRNQNKEPITFDYGSGSQGVVPGKWTLRVVVDAPFAVRWDDSPLATVNGDEASNAVFDLPVFQFDRDVEGLGRAIKAEAIGIGG